MLIFVLINGFMAMTTFENTPVWIPNSCMYKTQDAKTQTDQYSTNLTDMKQSLAIPSNNGTAWNWFTNLPEILTQGTKTITDVVTLNTINTTISNISFCSKTGQTLTPPPVWVFFSTIISILLLMLVIWSIAHLVLGKSTMLSP